jgi:hypothetical protein
MYGFERIFFDHAQLCTRFPYDPISYGWRAKPVPKQMLFETSRRSSVLSILRVRGGGETCYAFAFHVGGDDHRIERLQPVTLKDSHLQT